MPMTLARFLNREGFFSRMDNTSCSQATSNLSDTSSNIDIDFNTNELTRESSSPVVLHVHSEPNNRRDDGISGGHCLEGTTCESSDWQESTAHPEGNQLQCLQIESVDRQSSFSVGCERRDDTGQNVDVMAIRDQADELIQQSLQIDDSEHSSNQESSEVQNEQSELGDMNNGENNSSNHNDYVEGNVDDVNYGPDSLEEQLEEIIENEESGSHQSNTEWRNSTEESVDDNQLSNTENEWPENSWANEDVENPHVQEASEAWQEDGGFQEAVENWLGGPSDQESAQVGRVHGFYFPDDDNVYSGELRELHSRYVKMR